MPAATSRIAWSIWAEVCRIGCSQGVGHGWACQPLRSGQDRNDSGNGSPDRPSRPPLRPRTLEVHASAALVGLGLLALRLPGALVGHAHGPRDARRERATHLLELGARGNLLGV